MSVFPSPGDRVATAGTQITIRGIPTSAFGTIAVTGSKSGVHAGVVKADSDGSGGSFVPTTPFTAGETVTVQTGLDVIDGHAGRWSFTVQTPATLHLRSHKAAGTSPSGGVWRFRSRPDLTPAAVTVTRNLASHAPGDLFLGPQEGPLQNGVEIVNSAGRLVDFQTVPKGDDALDVNVQSYEGHPALTWWQGSVSAAGTGDGVDEIESSSYRHLATVRAGNGLNADLHEFYLGADDTAWITAYEPVIVDASKVKGGHTRQIVLDGVAQEIDLKTGLVLFQWDSLDHVALGASYVPVPHNRSLPWDFFHINSIQPLANGSVLISSRNTSAVYDVNDQTGRIQFTVGGKFSSFSLGAGARFWYQHNARLQSNGELTLFDDAGKPFRETQSRGLTLRLDTKTKRATVVQQFTHPTPLRAPAEGSDQPLSNGDTLLGWGQAPDLATEFNAKGKVVFDAQFTATNASYRVFRHLWRGTPTGRPAVATRTYDGQTTVSASWNGTTVTRRWRILGGNSRKALHTIALDRKNGFETSMQTDRRPHFVEVQAVGTHGTLLGTSRVLRTAFG